MSNLWAVQFILVDQSGSSYDQYGEYMQVTFDCMDYDNFTVAKSIRLLAQHCKNYGGVSLGKEVFISSVEINLAPEYGWQTYDLNLIKPELTRK